MFHRSFFEFIPTRPPQKKKHVRLLVDYDGFASFLFECNPETPIYQERLAQFKNEDRKHADLLMKNEVLIQEVKGLFKKLTQHADLVEIAIGSARQGIERDQHAANINKNGLCADVLALLCKEMGWVFVPTVLDRDTVKKTANNYELKKKVLLMHLSNIKQFYSQYESAVFYIDDESPAIKAIQEAAQQNKLPCLVTTVHANWATCIQKPFPTKAAFEKAIHNETKTKHFQKTPRLNQHLFNRGHYLQNRLIWASVILGAIYYMLDKNQKIQILKQLTDVPRIK